MDLQYIVNYLTRSARFLRANGYETYADRANRLIEKVKCARSSVLLSKSGVNFGPGLNVIMGPQGCGKSHLIRSITGRNNRIVFFPAPEKLEGYILDDIRSDLNVMFLLHVSHSENSDGANSFVVFNPSPRTNA